MYSIATILLLAFTLVIWSGVGIFGLLSPIRMGIFLLTLFVLTITLSNTVPQWITWVVSLIILARSFFQSGGD
jgi:hypothetical protein